MNVDLSFTKPFSTTLSKSPSVIPIIGIFKRYRISEATKEVGDKLIMKELEVVTNPVVKQKVVEYLENIHEGKRDFRF